MSPYPPARGEPIMVACEGSEDTAPHVVDELLGGEMVGMCRTCGARVLLDPSGSMPAHDRDDVLARLERGDFG